VCLPNKTHQFFWYLLLVWVSQPCRFNEFETLSPCKLCQFTSQWWFYMSIRGSAKKEWRISWWTLFHWLPPRWHTFFVFGVSCVFWFCYWVIECCQIHRCCVLKEVDRCGSTNFLTNSCNLWTEFWQKITDFGQRRLWVLRILILSPNFLKMGFSPKLYIFGRKVTNKKVFRCYWASTLWSRVSIPWSFWTTGFYPLCFCCFNLFVDSYFFCYLVLLANYVLP